MRHAVLDAVKGVWAGAVYPGGGGKVEDKEGRERLSITDQLLKCVEEYIGYFLFVSTFSLTLIISPFQIKGT